MPNHAALLRSLTLGTARQPIPSATDEWLAERDAVDPTADEAEQLLATWAITERIQRLQEGPRVEPANTAFPPTDEQALPSAKLSRGIQLVMQGTYPSLLPEVLQLLAAKQLQFPPFLLPELLDRIALLRDEAPEITTAMLEVAGSRGRWLANLNPNWKNLTDTTKLAQNWLLDITPGARVTTLKRWRQSDPKVAREALDKIWSKQSPKNQEAFLSAIEVNLSTDDLPWLRNQLAPKRRGVRRAIFQLLLRAGEQQALDDATTLAAASFTDEGKFAPFFPTDEVKELALSYGGQQKKETVADFLLTVLPANILPDLLGKTGTEFWVSLRKPALALAAKALLRYDLPDMALEFVRFACLGDAGRVPVNEAAELTAQLPQETFLQLFHQLLDEEKGLFHFGGLPRLLILSRKEPWSERLTKAFVLQLTRSMKDVYALPHATLRDMQAHWRLAIPLVHRSSFGWLRTQMHSMTERGDSFGKLATEMLQTTAFRRALWED